MKLKKIIGISVLAVVVIAGIFGVINLDKNSDENVFNGPKLISSKVLGDDGKLNAFMDNIGFDNIRELSNYSDVVVIGEVIKKTNKSRNLSRNPKNIELDAEDEITMSQEYKFKVSNWIKGTGSEIIDIVYSDYTEIKTTGVKFVRDPDTLIPNTKYVLFLNKGIEDTYYGSAQPWQFKIVSDKIKVSSNIGDFEIKDLKKFTLDELIKIVTEQ